jgi:hypothetical protein
MQISKPVKPYTGPMAPNMHVKSNLILHISRIALFGMPAAAFILFVLFNITSFGHNDFMYGTAAAVWAQHGNLYSDVPFTQAPLSIMLLLLLTKITGSVDILFPARVLSILLVSAAVLLPIVGKAKVQDAGIWALYVALCLTNPLITTNSNEIGNYAIALFCLSASVAIINMRGPALWRGFFACTALGLAVSAKLYFIVICPGIFLIFYFNDERLNRFDIAACGVGFLIGCSPVLYFLMLDYQSFWKYTVDIFFVSMKIRASEGVSPARQIALTSVVFGAPLAIPTAFTVAVAIQQYRLCGSAKIGAGRLIAVTCAYLMAISPGLPFPGYFAPLAFLVLLFSVPWHQSSKTLRVPYIFFSALLLCFQATFILILITTHTPALQQVMTIQSNARKIVDSNYKCDRRFYSAEPIFLLDNKIKYPRELGAGPFLLFLGRRAPTEMGSDFDIMSRIKSWDPDIVIWGYFLNDETSERDEVDRAVRDYAIARKFETQFLGNLVGHKIYLAYRPDCKA